MRGAFEKEDEQVSEITEQMGLFVLEANVLHLSARLNQL